MFSDLLLVLALLGTLTSSAYLLLVLAGVVRFRRRKRATIIGPQQWPGVTLLKPLHGAEPRLRENLESFFLQQYPTFEIVFGLRSAEDPAHAVVTELMAAHPEVPVRVVVSGEPPWPNAKVYNLSHMRAAASHDHFIVSDSDVAVAPGYIRAIMTELLQRNVGVVTCLYRGVATDGLWTELEALGMSVELPSGVLVAEALEGMKFALGPTMAVRRECLDAIGGFPALGDFLADDFVLGNRAAEAGYRVVLSTHVVDHIVLQASLAASFQHQVRWAKSTRRSRPKGHLGAGLTFAMPYGLMGMLGAVISGPPLLGVIKYPHIGIAMLLAAFANRVIQCWAVGWVALRDPNARRRALLYPLRDLTGFLFWATSYFGGRDTTWRGERYVISEDGRMVRRAAIARPAESKGAV